LANFTASFPFSTGVSLIGLAIVVFNSCFIYYKDTTNF
jgi:hypothetical protein